MASNNYEYNPIKGVREFGTEKEFQQVPVPSTFEWGLQDLSLSTAGRTEDNVMQKQRSGQLIKLTLEWHNLTNEQAANVLQAFNYEYIEVEYLSPFFGSYTKSNFYVGDRKGVLFNSKKGVWEKISFAITEREGEVKPCTL